LRIGASKKKKKKKKRERLLLRAKSPVTISTLKQYTVNLSIFNGALLSAAAPRINERREKKKKKEKRTFPLTMQSLTYYRINLLLDRCVTLSCPLSINTHSQGTLRLYFSISPALSPSKERKERKH